ncbi:hypothetical protein F0562_027170 [Nyssa sinensis]|uniref:FHA domain-containing protein n=1 Tax=Nyssa sinensis TaxID=561372 RepID=A0A5J5B6T0_9ASTE|nr:hypothetical protein F0562_027170 [Nyssa sinensis]
MGALAPVSPWIPEDDLLLKNAVEAGVSLESLAKGAVQFSQRFTVQEPQDRWNFLPYDPVVSAEASARMIEFECSAPIIPSKPNRFENLNEDECVLGKRKFESVHKCYYAMRKRICNEPLDSTDLSFLVAPGNNNCIGNGDESPSANGILSDPISNHFAVQNLNFDIMHCAFPQFPTGSAAGTSVDITAHAFCTGLQNPVEDYLHVDQNSMHKQIACTFAEDLSLTGCCSGIEELDQPEELPVCDLFEVDDLEEKALAIFDQINGNPGNICSGFRGSRVSNSPISDCGASFHNLVYSSPLPPTPIWCTIEGLSAPTPPDVHLNEKEEHTGDAFALPDDHDAKNTDTLGYDVVYSDSKLENQMQCDDMKTSIPSSDDYLVELSNTIFNFTSEEELHFVDDDGKDGIEKSYIDGLSLLLLDSPDVNGMPNMDGTRASVAAPDEYLSISGGVCPGELHDDGHPRSGDGYTIFSLEAKVLPSALTVDFQFSELCDGVICCMLNTEDTEIPCNDDVFLPIGMPSSLSSVTKLNFHEPNKPTSSFAKDFSDNRKTDARGLYVLKREGKFPEQSPLSSHMIGSQLLQETSLNHPFGDCGVNIELPNRDYPHVTIMSASTACQGPNQIISANIHANTFLPATLKDEAIEIEQAKHLLSYSSAYSYLEKPVHGFDGLVSYLQRNASCSEQEIDAPDTIQNYQALPAQLSYVEMTLPEPVVNASPSDQEELPSESDDDVPYFTDVEAMILDMDLSPDNQEYSSREVARYQHENNKRTIIGLEQAAHSDMRRVITSWGVLAVLYGRHSKHYIKKPEVLLGRATEDVNVDIDLGREGHANKISRREALIKMDKGGSFYLKNLGKCSIFVNNKEVTPKQSLRLTSSCSIEIRGIPFIFEMNQTCVKQYVHDITKES